MNLAIRSFTLDGVRWIVAGTGKGAVCDTCHRVLPPGSVCYRPIAVRGAGSRRRCPLCIPFGRAIEALRATTPDDNG